MNISDNGPRCYDDPCSIICISITRERPCAILEGEAFVLHFYVSHPMTMAGLRGRGVAVFENLYSRQLHLGFVTVFWSL